MDNLKSEQTRLCSWLSKDPEYILDQCGDILSMNEFREVQKQKSALDKMRLLLKIILQKGEETWQSFVGVLRQHQAHYQQLQQYFNPHTEGSLIPRVFADDGSVVSVGEMTDIKAKSLSVNIETVSNPGSRSSENVAPCAVYTAERGSAIWANKLTGVHIDGDLNFSMCVKPSQVQTDAVDGTLPSPQGPAQKMIIKSKVELTDCLRADLWIMQHVHAKGIVTEREYQKLNNPSQKEQSVIDLIDHVTRKGEEACVQFLQVLKVPEVLETYPKLKEILNIES